MNGKFKKCLVIIPVAVGALACFTACGEHEHTYSEAWQYNEEYHWHSATCEHSEEEKDRAGHTFALNLSKSTVNCEQDGIAVYECECGYSYKQQEKGGHILQITEGKEATCTEDGYTVREVCTRAGCDYVKESEVIPATGHTYSTAWEYDDENHWHVANCGHDLETEPEAHDLESSVCKCGYSLAGEPANFTYKRNGSEYTITGLSETAIEEGVTVLNIPAMYKGLKVTAIADFAFEHNTTITRAIIPAGVTELGTQAFNGCTALKAVKIPSGITKIGDNTFLNCTSLSSVTLPSGITYIGSQAFANCTSLTSISLSAGVQFIGMKAFKNTGLTSVELPGTVTYLGAYAFKDCSALVSAKIGSGITYTVGDWFSGCGALESLTIPFVGSRMDAPLAVSTAFGYIFGTTAPKQADADKFDAVEQGGTTYYIPKSLTSVTILGGQYDEWRNDEKTVKDYTLPANAFSGCTMIEEIIVAAGVAEDADAFEGWDGKITRL